MTSRNIPHDIVAEESLLGAMLLSGEAALVGVENCRATDFYVPRNQRIFAAISEAVEMGLSVDPVTVAAAMADNTLLPELTSMMMNTPSSVGAASYAKIVVEHSAARQMLSRLSQSVSLLSDGADPYFEAEAVGDFVASLGAMRGDGTPESQTLDELIASMEDDADVIIPGMMNRDYRTIVVAEEGSGKSVILRTIAMSAAQGFHPFSHKRIPAVRALIVDLENPKRALLETSEVLMRTLQERNHLMHDDQMYSDERLRFWRRPGGIDIRRLSDRVELQREIAFHKPDLVCMGPVYKMYRKQNGEQYEDAADGAMQVLDDLRTKYGFALVLEHHAAKGQQGQKRDLAPMGSQRWLAWPEVGVSLYKRKDDQTAFDVSRYRGDRLQGVNWPDRLVRDKTWLIDGSWDAGMPR